MTVRSGSHTTYDIKYHFVWIPKYRTGILTKVRRAYLLYLPKHIAREFDLNIVEVEVMPDHVHLFIESSPRRSPAQIMNAIKSISAREMFKKFPELRKFLWGGELWGDGYFVATVGDKVTTEVIRNYIRHQREPTMSGPKGQGN